MLELLGIKQVNLNQDTQEDVDFGDDLFALLLAAVLCRCLGLNVFDLCTSLTSQGQVLLAQGDQQLFRDISGCDRGGEGLDNDLGKNVGSEAFAKGGNRSQCSQGESGIEQGNSTVEQCEIALDI